MKILVHPLPALSRGDGGDLSIPDLPVGENPNSLSRPVVSTIIKPVLHKMS